MNKWMGVLYFVIAGCTEYRDLAQVSSNQGSVVVETDDPASDSDSATTLDVACEALMATRDEVDAQADADGDYGIVNVLYDYYRAYCNEPTLDEGTSMYCYDVDRLASEACRANAAPFIDCLANHPTTDPATDCSAVLRRAVRTSLNLHRGMQLLRRRHGYPDRDPA